MSRVETCALTNDGTVWPFSSFDSHTRPLVSAATAIKCRLEKVTRNQLSPNGEILISDAVCYVDTTITVGSIFRLGTVASVPTPANNLFEVMVYDELDDILGKNTFRWVELNLWNKVLPTIE